MRLLAWRGRRRSRQPRGVERTAAASQRPGGGGGRPRVPSLLVKGPPSRGETLEKQVFLARGSRLSFDPSRTSFASLFSDVRRVLLSCVFFTDSTSRLALTDLLLLCELGTLVVMGSVFRNLQDRLGEGSGLISSSFTLVVRHRWRVLRGRSTDAPVNPWRLTVAQHVRVAVSSECPHSPDATPPTLSSVILLSRENSRFLLWFDHNRYKNLSCFSGTV